MCPRQPSVVACGVPVAVAAGRVDDLQAAVTALPWDAILEELPAVGPSAECTPDCIPESGHALHFAETVLAEGAFALAVFITASAAGEAFAIRGMADTAMRAPTIRIGGGTRPPPMTTTRSANWRWP